MVIINNNLSWFISLSLSLSLSLSPAGAIVAGILVPLFVIILVLVGVAAGWYFYRKRVIGGRYVRLNVQGKDIDDAGGYGAT